MIFFQNQRVVNSKCRHSSSTARARAHHDAGPTLRVEQAADWLDRRTMTDRYRRRR